jgi:hypothetical protein
LAAGTTYYVRAYATNSVGTAYGNEISFTASPNIGQFFRGGLVFYVDETGQHGLTCATTEQSTARWDNGEYLTTNASGTAVGTGQSNTTAIINVQGVGTYSASICNDYIITAEGVTYDDWFLPSKDELMLMYTKLKVAGLGGFSDAGGQAYWSSSEYGPPYYYAWNQWFGDVYQNYLFKEGFYYGRPVRAF